MAHSPAPGSEAPPSSYQESPLRPPPPNRNIVSRGTSYLTTTLQPPQIAVTPVPAPTTPATVATTSPFDTMHIATSELTIIPETDLQPLEPYAETGALINRSDATHAMEQHALNPDLLWPRVRRWLRDPFSEFLGTFILVLFGDGAVAQVTLSADKNGGYQSIAWGYGIGLMLGVYTAGASGAHLNPCVTLTNVLFRDFPIKRFPIYLLAQLLGAMCAAAVVYGNYKSAIDVYEGGAGIRTVPGYSDHATAGIFATYPAPFTTRAGQFFSEFIGSTILMFMIYALKDDGNLGAGMLTPVALMFVMFGIASCFGWQTGFALNLARDLGPRLVTYAIGYGNQVWASSGYYFWIPMVAPFCGCLVGGLLYDFFLFTGQSPLNRPYFGLYRFVPGLRERFETSMPRVSDKEVV